jgi:hypothetical protein
VSDETIHRAALFFMVAVGAVAANLWAQHEHAPAPPRTADPTLAQWFADKDARVSELIGRRVMNPNGQDLGEVEDVLATAVRGERRWTPATNGVPRRSTNCVSRPTTKGCCSTRPRRS